MTRPLPTRSLRDRRHPAPSQPVRPRLLARDPPHRRHPAQGDRRRRAAARRPRCSPWSGRTRRGRTATRRCGTPRRPGRAAPRPDPRRTWAADGLLAIFFFVAGLELKREFVAGDLRDPRRAAVPVAAAVGGVIVPALLYAADRPAPTAALPGLGDPDRHRHRLRPRRAGRDRPAPARRRCAPSCSPWPWSTTCSRSSSSRSSTPRDLAVAAAARRAGAAGGLRRCWCSGGCGPGGCCCRWPPRPGRWCTPPACTPRSPVCCSPSPSRCSAARPPAARTPGRAWPSTSSTGSGRSRPGSPCRSSPSSPPASPSAAWPAWPPR